MKDENFKIEFLGVCDYAFLAKGEKLSLIGLFDRIFVDKLPANHPRMFVVAIFKSSPNSLQNLDMKILDDEGKAIFSQPLEVRFSFSGVANFITDLVNFPIARTGKLEIQLISGDKVLKSSFITIEDVNKDKKNDLPN